MKKFISFILTFSILCSVLSFVTAAAYTGKDFGYRVKEDGTAVIVQYYGDASELTIPSVLYEYTVSEIADFVFSGDYGFTSISIPDSVTKIGRMAFSGSDTLKSVKISAGVKEMDCSFCECYALTNIDVDPDNKYFSSENGVLFNKDKTTLYQYPIGKYEAEYTVPEGVEIIGEYAFSSAGNLEKVTIPDGVKTIGSGAFSSCFKLGGVTIPNSVGKIEQSAFFSCIGLKDVTISNSIDTIEYDTFSSCYSLTSIVVPEGVKDIKNKAFRGCSNLISVTIPVSVTNIGISAFDDCEKISDVYYAGSKDAWAVIFIDMFNDAVEKANIHFDYSNEKKAAVGGSFSGFGADGENVKIQLIESVSGEVMYELNISGDTYTFDSVLAGTYIIKITKPGCTAAEQMIEINGSDVTCDVKISMLGDADSDGDISMKDVIIIRKHSLGMIDDDVVDLYAAKVFDGIDLTLKDALAIRKYIMGLIYTFPVES